MAHTKMTDKKPAKAKVKSKPSARAKAKAAAAHAKAGAARARSSQPCVSQGWNGAEITRFAPRTVTCSFS